MAGETLLTKIQLEIEGLQKAQKDLIATSGDATDLDSALQSIQKAKFDKLVNGITEAAGGLNLFGDQVDGALPSVEALTGDKKWERLLKQIQRAQRDMGKLATETEQAADVFGDIPDNVFDKPVKGIEKLDREFNDLLDTLKKTESQSKGVVGAFSKFDENRDRVTNASSIFGDVGTDFRTLTGAGAFTGLISPETEKQLNNVAEVFDSVEASARLAANGSALLSKSLAAFPGLLGPAGLAIAGVAAVAAGAALAVSVLTSAQDRRIESIQVEQVELLTLNGLIGKTVDELRQLSDTQQVSIERLKAQRIALESEIDASDGFEEAITGLFKVSSADKAREKLAEVNRELNDAIQNTIALADAERRQQALDSQRDFLNGLDDEADRKRFIVDLQETADTASVDRLIKRAELEKEISDANLVDIERQIEAQAELQKQQQLADRANILRAAIETLPDDITNKLTDLDKQIIASAESYEDLNTRIVEAIERRNVTKGSQELTNVLAANLQGSIAESLKGATEGFSIDDFFSVGDLELGTLNEQREAEIRNNRNLSTELQILNEQGREFAKVNEAQTQATENYVQAQELLGGVFDSASISAKQLADEQKRINDEYQTTTERIGVLSGEIAAIQFEELIQAGRDAQRANLEAAIAEAERAEATQAAAQRITDIENDFIEKRADIIQDGNEKLQDIRDDFFVDEIERNQGYYEDIQDNETDHRRRLAEIAKEANRALEDAALNNDVNAFLSALTNRDQQTSDANTEQDQFLQDRTEQLRRETEAATQAFQERLTEQQAANQQSLSDLKQSLNERLTTERQAQEVELKQSEIFRQQLAEQEQFWRNEDERQRRLARNEAQRAELQDLIEQRNRLAQIRRSGVQDSINVAQIGGQAIGNALIKSALQSAQSLFSSRSVASSSAGGGNFISNRSSATNVNFAGANFGNSATTEDLRTISNAILQAVR